MDLSKTNTETEINQISTKIIKGVSNYPNLIQEDNLYQYEFASFKVENNTITNFVDKRTYVNIQSIYNSISDKTDTLLDEIYKALSDVLDGSAYVLKTGGTVEGELKVDKTIVGNCETASKLLKPRKINIIGAATGSADFDGSNDITLDINIKNGTTNPSDGEDGDIYVQYFT